MSVLIISPERWTGHFVSKHHYAIELASRGNRVIFHGPPTSGPMRLEPVRHDSSDLEVLHAPKIAPGLQYLPGMVRRGLEARWLKRVEALIGERIDVVWLFENSRFYDMRFAGDRLKVYHQVDLNQDFHPKTAARTADFVFCSSKLIRDRLSEVGKEVTIINHGVRAVHFEPSTEAVIFDKERVNCVYVGNLSMAYLDRDLILRCVNHLQDVCFHFVGGFDQGDPFQEKLTDCENVRLHGRVSSNRILPIITNADILMVAYQERHFKDQSNPHKMMEYMMSGKVIVATHTSEYEAVADLLAMANPNDDYMALLEHVTKNIETFNTKDRQAARRDFALDNTYNKQLDRIVAAIGPSAATFVQVKKA